LISAILLKPAKEGGRKKEKKRELGYPPPLNARTERRKGGEKAESEIKCYCFSSSRQRAWERKKKRGRRHKRGAEKRKKSRIISLFKSWILLEKERKNVRTTGPERTNRPCFIISMLVPRFWKKEKRREGGGRQRKGSEVRQRHHKKEKKNGNKAQEEKKKGKCALAVKWIAHICLKRGKVREGRGRSAWIYHARDGPALDFTRGKEGARKRERGSCLTIAAFQEKKKGGRDQKALLTTSNPQRKGKEY